MDVLVCAASRYGSTREIARAIGRVLGERGVRVTISEPQDVADLGPYGAAVLGSAVYAGHWLKTAKELVERVRPELEGRPVWLFSSGPVGDPPKPEEDPVDVANIASALGVREHRVFPGKIDRKGLRFADRAIVAALKVPDGDFRDWDAVERWAEEIADSLGGEVEGRLPA
jgi:menaquinone-dependent protoporphyrinogen oxidase